MAEIIVLLFALYAAVGVVVALLVVFRGLERIDPAAADGTRGFRLIILPGAVLLWPVLLRRFLAAAGATPTERTAHRLAAGTARATEAAAGAAAEDHAS